MTTLYISDLDGTLLRSDATLSDYSRKTLNTLLERGVQFTVASARSVVPMQSILAGLQLRLPVIELNGAFITDLYTGQHYVVNAMQPDIVQSILQQTRNFDFDPFISTFDGTADRLYYQHIPNDGMAWYLQNRERAKDPRLAYSDDLRQTFREQVVWFTIIGEGAKLADLAQTFRDSFGETIRIMIYEDQYSPGWHWLTIHDRRADKALAIRTLVEMNGIKTDEVVTFGDQVNDVNMLKGADRGIAVANAIPEVKFHANQVIGSNQEDSVVKFIDYEELTAGQ